MRKFCTKYISVCIVCFITSIIQKISNVLCLKTLSPRYIQLSRFWQAIDYLSSFLKVECLSQNLTLQRCIVVHSILYFSLMVCCLMCIPQISTMPSHACILQLMYTTPGSWHVCHHESEGSPHMSAHIFCLHILYLTVSTISLAVHKDLSNLMFHAC